MASLEAIFAAGSLVASADAPLSESDRMELELEAQEAADLREEAGAEAVENEFLEIQAICEEVAHIGNFQAERGRGEDQAYFNLVGTLGEQMCTVTAVPDGGYVVSIKPTDFTKTEGIKSCYVDEKQIGAWGLRSTDPSMVSTASAWVDSLYGLADFPVD